MDKKPLNDIEYIKRSKDLWKECNYKEAIFILEAAIEKFPESRRVKDLYDEIRADRAKRFEFQQIKLSGIKFCIDSMTDKTFRREAIRSLKVTGWVAITQPNSDLLIEQDGKNARICEISIYRKDVATYLSKQGFVEPIAVCGFSFVADLSKPITLTLRTPQGSTPFVKLTGISVRQVLEGKDGWLFLDNDTNRSADIFTGKTPATPEIASAWIDFSKVTKEKLDFRNIASCIVISPSKEDVFPEHHPLEPASVSIIDVAYSSIFIGGSLISCPVRKLRKEPASYYKTDTHWSHLGAWICVLDILAILKLPTPSFSACFNNMEVVGDLGAKVNPARKSIQKVWNSQCNSSYLSFDNKILGSGNIKVYRNKGAYIKKSVLIFGGSSSTHLSKIMSDIFIRVTHVNAPSTMPIFDIIDKDLPDIVIMQTSSRYLLDCPKVLETTDGSPLERFDSGKFPNEWII